MLGLTSKDNSGAFRCYRVSKLAEIDLERVRSRGYSFQEEILFWCQTVGCRIGETPILFENRRERHARRSTCAKPSRRSGSCFSSACARLDGNADQDEGRLGSDRRLRPRLGLASSSVSLADQAISRSRTVT